MIPYQVRNDIGSKIVVIGLFQKIEEQFRPEQIDTHGSQRTLGVVGNGLRFPGLFLPGDDAEIIVHFGNAELRGLVSLDLQQTDADVGIMLFMVFAERHVIHLVDMIPRQDQDQTGTLPFEQIEVLAYTVGCSSVPFLAQSLLRGGDAEVMPEIGGEDIPALFQVIDHGLGFILGKDEDLVELRVDTVA